MKNLMKKKRCARDSNQCNYRHGLYLSTSYTMYNPDKTAPSSMKVEALLRKHGYKGAYMDSKDDPHAHSEWLCRPHFLESEFGLVMVECPFCQEDFAFDHSHFYSDDSHVKCPKCGSVVYGKHEIKDVPTKEIKEWWNDRQRRHKGFDIDEFIEWFESMKKVID